ncbi:hypothetical protein Jab_1c16330 [Janthinobacterium sp. HH01]|uniref:hypothetical protein n=1 Tax=Janthinobacterium sp. HH01 TaxID=1198452 RepID=UPI0002AE81D5|nr:hypothetical protein [Janthinobacterium sp. HH01]ELX13014.1 hypothetical protein Jab_1c16330 [Janthinobacterium sp. HH01]
MKAPRLMRPCWLLALAAGFAVAGPASATAIGDPFSQYNITHNFNFSPAGGILSGVWNYQVGTSASAPFVQCGVLSGSVPLPANALQNCNSVALSGASANANSSVTTTNFVPGNAAGQVHVDGFANVPVRATAASAAKSEVVIHGGNLLRNGRVIWGPAFTMSATARATARARDPISFDILDPDTGLHTTGVLEDIDAELTGAGSVTWAGNILSVDADQFVFNIDLDSSFIPASERGTVDFIITNGIVTTSISTGIFAGLLPTVGSSGTFSTAFSNDLVLDYNLGSLGGANALVDFTLGGAGAAVAMPAPDTLLLAGTGLMLLGLFVRRSKLSQGQ